MKSLRERAAAPCEAIEKHSETKARQARARQHQVPLDVSFFCCTEICWKHHTWMASSRKTAALRKVLRRHCEVYHDEEEMAVE